MTAALTWLSYLTSLQSAIGTSLKLFFFFVLSGRCNLYRYCSWGVCACEKRAIRLRNWLKVHRSHFHQGGGISLHCQVPLVHQIKNSHAWTEQPPPPHSFAKIYNVYIYVHVWTRLYCCYFAGVIKKKRRGGGGLPISQMNKWNIKLVRLRASFFVLLHYN